MSKPTEPGVYAVMRPRKSPRDYLTAGRYYRTQHGMSERSFQIISDTGSRLYCLWEGCAHLDDKNWRKVIVE